MASSTGWWRSTSTVTRSTTRCSGTTSAAPDAAADLVEELGGPDRCAELTGSVFNASYTITKLRWMRDHEPDAVGRIRDVMLPHDYLTWHLAGRGSEPTTDRGDASGTGYWSPSDDAYLPDLVKQALGRDARLPRIASAREVVGRHGRHRDRPGHGRQHGRGPGARPPARATSPSRSARRASPRW